MDEISFQCTTCKRNFRVDTIELDRHNVGTHWSRIYCLKCPHCLTEAVFPRDEESYADLLHTINGKATILDEYGNEVTKNPIPPGEYLLQEYVAQNAIKVLGKTIKQKARRFGPDFKIDDDTFVKVENNSSDYLKHGHHLDPKYNKVRFLIVENVQKLPPKLRKLLPPKNYQH